MDLEALAKHREAELIVGFFELMGYSKWCEDRPPHEELALAAALFNCAGHAIANADGVLIKAMGDAGLFVFPTDDPDRAVLALRAMKRDCDGWLSERGYPDVISVKLQVGAVACGKVGPPSDACIDVCGMTVNRAARMRGRAFAVSADARRGLSQLNDDEFVADD